jgi:hypothetical protein
MDPVFGRAETRVAEHVGETGTDLVVRSVPFFRGAVTIEKRFLHRTRVSPPSRGRIE